MARYQDFSMSNNAVTAYAEGLCPASKVKGGVPASLIEKFCSPREWHHTSSRFNRTNFYSPADVRVTFGLRTPTVAEIEDGIEPNAEAITALAAWRTSQKTPADVRYGELSYAWWSGQGRSLQRHVSKFVGDVEFKGNWAIFDGRKIKLSGNNYEGFKPLV